MSLAVQINKTNGIPLYIQLEEQIRLLMHRGELKPGDLMPTVRSLAVELEINSNTVSRVYRDLQNEGLLTLKRGVGTSISEQASVRPDVPPRCRNAGKEGRCTDRSQSPNEYHTHRTFPIDRNSLEGELLMLTGSNNVIAWTLLTLSTIIVSALAWNGLYTPAVACAPVGLFFTLSPRIMKDWDRGVLLRLGKFTQVLKPGVSWIIPGIDAIAANVDMRIRSTSFSAEKTLTQDTVPVNVDAVLFWVVTDAQRSIP